MAKTAKKQRVRGRPFQPGQSGNPRGRPKGALGKRTLLMRRLEASGPVELLEAQTEITDAVIHYFSQSKMLSVSDFRLAMRVYLSINDYLGTLLEAAGRIDRHKETVG